ncbi:Nuclear transport factor 2 family protein with RNA binding domain [Theobroma cacao]|uniref:Nuclear transport factor 2 family protein with RNA binding domain n=1 Tax=Theobroma cacao TaxID=3641 RepID=A0A061DNP4_THECC|nr:Nuclear transport factor 2 family protein with RNA binding domain [Theobroma cacao]
MATSYPGPVQVGSYFVGQYYQVLQQQPDLVHQFYSDASTMIRVDGDSSESASATLQIHSMVMSLNFTAIEIKTINSLDSWNGGVLVMVSGSVKIKDFNGRRKFVQTFLLAPQEKGYFVLNDIFQFIDDGMIYQHPASTLQENKLDAQLNVSSPVAEPPATAVSDYVLEEDAREYVNSVHIEDDPIDKYSLPEQPPDEVVEAEVVVEEAPAEEALASHHSGVNTVQEPPAMPLEEPVAEPARRTYAAILRVMKEQSTSSVQVQPSYNKIPQSSSDWDHTPEPTNQQSRPAWSDVPESVAETAEEGLVSEEGEYTGEYKSVYVRNLPSTVTAAEIEQEFKNFGRIKPEGVFIRNRKDVVGVCYAFVEFEDILAVQNAIRASPIQLAGRQVYIEERRPNSSSTRGGRRGRGRGIYQAEASRGRFGSRSLGRGTNQESGDYRSRGNGFYQRGSR